MKQLFETLFPVGNPDKISKEKSLSKGNLNCYILGTEGQRTLNFGEVSLQIG